MRNGNIKVVGVGESGARAISKMVKTGVGMTGGVEFVAVGNDENLLLTSPTKTNIFLNRDSTLIYKRISSALRGAKVVIIVTGAGSSAAAKSIPQIVSCAKNQNSTTVAFVNRPFVLENAARKAHAEFCLNALHRDADTIFDVPTEKFFVFRLHQSQVSLDEVFDVANEIFAQGVDIFIDMISKSDSLGNWGNAAFGCGLGVTTLDAIKAAVNFPLLDPEELKRTPKIFVRLNGGDDISAKNFIRNKIKSDAKLFWRVDNSATGKIFASIVFSRKEV